VVAAMKHECKGYDGHLTAEVRDKSTDLTGTTLHKIIGDHGYFGTDINAPHR
jgi:hypothetical protein